MIKTAKIDTSSKEFTNIVERYATDATRTRILRKTAENRVREDGAAFVLPQFDSLPATAGLSNAEAFRLSIRQALALLPTMFAKGMDERPGADYPDRFSID